jgi:hypothetical protein
MTFSSSSFSPYLFILYLDSSHCNIVILDLIKIKHVQKGKKAFSKFSLAFPSDHVMECNFQMTPFSLFICNFSNFFDELDCMR